MALLTRIKTGAMDLNDRREIYSSRKNEYRKFQDPRRKKIYDSVVLTKEQETQIDELYIKNYGERIPYIWHRHFTAFTGTFDPCYFPELLYIPEFERFMNMENDYGHVLADKSLLPLLASWGGISVPRTILSSACGILRDGDMREIKPGHAIEMLSDIGRVFIKISVDSNSGRGCSIADLQHGKDVLTGRSIKEILLSLGENFVIQERIRCHESLARIYPYSVNTFRIITYRWKDEICHMPFCLRLGRDGKFLDNGHAGGIFVSVDDNGVMGRTAYSEFCERFDQHPDTGFVFENVVLEIVPDVLRAVERMCGMLPWIGCINWDVSINEQGEPVLIEANTRGGSIWLSEMPNEHGPFGEKTLEVLRWMRLMKRLKASERKRYRFGKM